MLREREKIPKYYEGMDIETVQTGSSYCVPLRYCVLLLHTLSGLS